MTRNDIDWAGRPVCRRSHQGVPGPLVALGVTGIILAAWQYGQDKIRRAAAPRPVAPAPVRVVTRTVTRTVYVHPAWWSAAENIAVVAVIAAMIVAVVAIIGRAVGPVNAGVVLAVVILLAGALTVVIVRRRPPQPGSRVHLERDPLAAAVWALHGQLTEHGHQPDWRPLDLHAAAGACLRCGGQITVTGDPGGDPGGIVTAAWPPLGDGRGPMTCPGPVTVLRAVP